LKVIVGVTCDSTANTVAASDNSHAWGRHRTIA
jgi:hypothetical protein